MSAEASKANEKPDPGESEAPDSLAGERIHELPNPFKQRWFLLGNFKITILVFAVKTAQPINLKTGRNLNCT